MVSSNRKNLKKFSDTLYELMVEQKLSLTNSLIVMSKHKGKGNAISFCSKEILDELEKGETFGNALKACKSICFDKTYITFVRFSEKTGNLMEIISFLKMRCKRQDENFNRIIETLLYPLFVIILAFCAVGFLFVYGKSVFTAEQMDTFSNGNLISSCGGAMFFLVTFCFCGGWIIKRNLGSDKLYEAFLTADFLVKNGESFSSAIETAADILGKDSAEGKLFLVAKERLEYGIDLKNAFVCDNSRKWEEIQDMFFFAENAGSKSEVFEKIAGKLKLDSERKRNICLKLIEPMFIAGTGGFLLIFLMNTALPLLSGEMFSF